MKKDGKKVVEKRLKQKFDSLSIDKIETDAQLLRSSMLDSQENLYEILYYLKFTYRFRENKQYKKANWTNYLQEIFGISELQFHNNINAWFQFPKEAKELGPGLITTIRKKCGLENVKPVVNKIMVLKERTHPKIMDIIEKNRSPQQKKKDNKPSYAALERQLATAKDEIFRLRQENGILEKRIAKLVDAFKEDLPSYAAPPIREMPVVQATV